MRYSPQSAWLREEDSAWPDIRTLSIPFTVSRSSPRTYLGLGRYAYFSYGCMDTVTFGTAIHYTD